MISFDNFILKDDAPIYLQILTFLKRGMIAGTIVNGDELPSRRMLSALLGVNPNTVQKAYRMLEEEGLVQSHSGAKSYVVLNDKKVSELRRQVLEGDGKAIVQALKQMGLNKQQALDLIEACWNEV